jgi:CDP-diacylglycerol--serine O-phosphatidyltransferase
LKPEKKGRVRRGVYLLPSLFTVGTLVCGYIAILSTLKATGMDGDQVRLGFDTAAKAIGWAVVFDALDGRIARLTNACSDFGREFDSLADVVTFGVAPAFLAFAWGIRPVEEVAGTQLVQHLRDAGWVVTFAFVICGAARLARFNIDSGKPSSDRRHFVGLPIPGAAAVIAALVHCIKYPINDWIYGIVWLAIVAALAFLMVSKVRYPSFKTFDLRRRRPYFAIILIGLIIYAIWAFSEPVLLAIALLHGLSGPTSRLVSKIRPNQPPPQEVHVS